MQDDTRKERKMKVFCEPVKRGQVLSHLKSRQADIISYKKHTWKTTHTVNSDVGGYIKYTIPTSR